MASAYLATPADQLRTGWGMRFTPQHWTIDFPRPMMAAVTAPGPRTLRIDLDFLTRRDLAGLIWTSEDRLSHPLLARSTQRDYRGVILSFDWTAGPGLMPLDALNGPVLTIEGRDAGGVARIWYVRLWNYAVGTPTAARIRLDFADLRAGFGPDGEPVFPGDIDRLFVSLVPAGYDGSAAALAAPVSTFVELGALRAEGMGAVIPVGDAFLPEHRLRIASGYDDSYNQVPERLVAQWRALGFRGLVNHYVGMSHFPRLAAANGRFEAAGGLCGSARAWHKALALALRVEGMELILSLSFELFDENCPADWAQRTSGGARALTGYLPPSTLLSPCNAAAMGWLQGIASDLIELALAQGHEARFQVGEPWWWVGADGVPCFYDAATVSRWTAERGQAPPAMADVAGSRTAAERDWLDWLGARLADSTAALVTAARGTAAAVGEGLVSHLLFYAPQVLDGASPELRRANMPTGWAAPAFDVLQLEDYSFVTGGDEGGSARARTEIAARLGYPLARQHYLAGFVANAGDRFEAWPRVAAAAREAFGRQVPEVFVWAWPQVARDGFAWVGGDAAGEDAAVEAFHDVRFPLDLGFEAVGGPQFSTQVATGVSGHERRNSLWASGRLSYDAGLGIRSEADLETLLAFFRARRGQAFGFRFRDPLDWTSGPGGTVSPTDQLLGTGDGLTRTFALVKHYGAAGMAEARPITRPVSGTVRVALDGAAQATGWSVDGGRLLFDAPPGPGVEVRAGFAFDVPVRFATDRLDISLSGWRAGDVPSVPLVEVRE